MKTIVFTRQAARELDALHDSVRKQIMSALVGYATTGEGDVKRLSGRDGFRLRVGNYRVLFSEDRLTVLAVYVGRRSTTTYRR